MSSVFKKPKPKKDKAQEELVRKQQERIKEQDSEVAQRKASKRQSNKGRASLISGAETGNTGGPGSTPTRTTTG